MTNADKKLIETGNWGENVTWKLYETTALPPAELCTAVMCVAVCDGKIVLACSERGWGLLGGHIEDDESLESALHREAKEEGGYAIDQFQLFAVRQMTSTTEVPHQRSGKNYPFPTSYMAYYWATTSQPLETPTGEEIIESGSFGVDELAALGTPDRLVIEAGWRVFVAHATLASDAQ